jgi:nucleoside-diphosphate-sugar epimerase
MSKIVLILGASGKIGRHSANAFKLAGWNVRIFDRSKDDIVESSKGVDVIVNGMNPKGYANWAEDIPKTTSQVILAAKASGATVIIPGNIYVYGERSGLLDENTPHNAKTRKGRIRIEMEAEYKKASYEGVQSIIRKRCIDHTWVLIFHGSKASILDCLCLLTIAVSVFVIYW